jgi:hypothetical protein
MDILFHNRSRLAAPLLFAMVIWAATLSRARADDSVISSVVPASSAALNGDTIQVAIHVDMSGVTSNDSLLGSFTASLEWDDLTLKYVSDSGLLSGFTGLVATDDVTTGRLDFNAAAVSGVGGSFDVLVIQFEVIGPLDATTTLDLEYSAMAAALTFVNLLPALTTNDGSVSVVLVQGQAIAALLPADSIGTIGEIITAAIIVDMSGVSPPNELLGSFSGGLNWDPTILRFVNHTGPLSGFAGLVNSDNASAGVVTFSAANAVGAGERFNIVNITYEVVGEEGSKTQINLEFTAMAAAVTFNDLLPVLTVSDSTVEVNRSPQIEEIGELAAVEDAPFEFQVQASDANGESLRFTLVGTPDWLTLDGGTGMLAGTPENEDVGLDSATVRVEDERGSTATADFKIRVQNTNDPPQPFDLLEPEDGVSVGTLNPKLVWQHASDVDAGDTLRYQVTISRDPDFATPLTFSSIEDSMFTVPGGLERAVSYHWKVTALDLDSAAVESSQQFIFTTSENATHVDEQRDASIPKQFDLFQNYPNPFNPETTIRYDLPKSTRVRVEIFNALGQQIRTLVDEEKPAGSHAVIWNGLLSGGQQAPSGVYIFRLTTEEFKKSLKLVLLR